jgi:ABC-2 type transport system permease protein
VSEPGAPLGAVYDRGYRPYDGPRGGRWAPVGALWRTSLRRALGLRRPWRQKIAPWALLGVVTVPAVVNIGIGYLSRDSPMGEFRFFTYREYVGVSTALLAFVAIVAPDLVCPDRRNRVLTIVFARPIDGRGYVAAKLGAIVGLVFAFGFLPHVVLYIGQMLLADDALDYVANTSDVLWKVPVSVAVLALYYGTFGLAVASLTSRRIVAAVAFLGALLASGIVAAILQGDEAARTAWSVIALSEVPLHVRDLVFLGYVDPLGPLAGVTGAGAMALGMWALVVGGSVVTLLWRYRSEETA